MLKNLSVTGLALALATTAHISDASAQGIAKGQYYAGGFVGGISFTNDLTDSPSAVSQLDRDDTGFIFGAVLGRGFANNLRGELEISKWSADGSCAFKCKTSGSYNMDALQILGNLWLDIPLESSNLTPYVGGGIGYLDYSAETIVDDLEASGMSYQVGGGVTIPVGGSALIDIGYRYKSANVEYDSGPADTDLSETLSGNFLQIGVLFPF
ncbi:MAG: outer membrane beta-barrel protein [Pseudomonadota bacterium]